MINEITIRNVKTGKEIKMDKVGTTGFVIDEIDWGLPSISNESYRIPFQIGETLSNVIVGVRSPVIRGYIVSNQIYPIGITWEEYYKKQERDIFNLKNVLNKFISIYDEYEIIAGDYYLKCKPTQPVKYSSNEKENNEILCLFSLEVTCYNPMFLEVGGSTEEFYHVDSMFKFPMAIPQEEGILIGVESNIDTKTIVNEGDTDTGFVAIMKVKNGIVKFPEIRNLSNGENMKIYDSIVASEFKTDDYIYINTNNGEEDIYYYDSETKETKSLIGELSTSSKFIQLQRGENIIMYVLGEGSTGQVDFEIQFDNSYFSIEEM